MYQAVLSRRYLTSKIMPLLAAVAISLCVAMVLVVWSVMGGFLETLLAKGSSVLGDVAIERPASIGLPYYNELVEELEALDEVQAATPVIETIGLLSLPTGDQRIVVALGVKPDGYDEVTGYYDRLHWKPIEEPLPRDDDREDPRLLDDRAARFQAAQEEGRALATIDPDTGAPTPAMVAGIEVAGFAQRLRSGAYAIPGRLFAPNYAFTLGVLAISQRGVAIESEYRSLPVANEFRSGMYDVDSKYVIVPFDLLQGMLKLGPARTIDPDYVPGFEIGPDGIERRREPTFIETSPAKATQILIRAREGVTPRQLEPQVEAVYERFMSEKSVWIGEEALWRANSVYIWEQKPGLRQFIEAVRKETGLVLVLFVFISLTAVFLVGAIFWSIVSEKTRDVGILRAVGASRLGVAWLFVRYGLALGVVGSALGGALAWLIVTNINPIHEWIGQVTGRYVWDPSVYYFTEIPSKVDPSQAAIVVGGGVFFSILGALIPAARAAWMDPVKALRFE